MRGRFKTGHLDKIMLIPILYTWVIAPEETTCTLPNDYLFDLKAQREIELPFDLIDELVEEGLKVAKLKYSG
jgi:hypothetical protein